MLSEDLEFLARELDIRRDAFGGLTLPPTRTEFVGKILEECVRMAKQLEANAVRRDPVLVDLSDPKIELFPVAKRPVPADGASNSNPHSVLFFGIDLGRDPDEGGAA